jgi:RNA-directed DNA polymerase
MQESHGKGPASHPDPESCVDGRKAGGEALTGAHAGQPWSCAIIQSGVPTPLSEAEGHTGIGATGKPISDPAQSKTLRMRGNLLHGNREVPQAPAADGATGRPEKVVNHTSGTHACGKSDGRVVPEKPSNKGMRPAEAGEGRRPAEGNSVQAPAPQTLSWTGAWCGLHRVRIAARRDKRARFTALLHHVTVDLLREGFYALKRHAAPGVDGLTWQQYEADLEDRIPDLHRRVHLGTYRAQPSRRTFIPKADGRMRPLGIAALEDKIVQQAVVTVLNQIYEVDFLGFSYGFRPRRGPHDALDSLWVGLMGKKVNWVLDADIRGFFDSAS